MKVLHIIALLTLLWACGNGDMPADAYGNFEADEIVISAEASGRIIQMNVREGDVVQRGQPIAVIDTTQLYLKRGQILATMEALRDKLQDIPRQLDVFYEQESVLEKEHDRVSRLVEGGAATQKQLDDIAGQLSVVRKQRVALESQLSTGNRAILSELKPMQWQLRQVDDAIARSISTAPVDGTVLSTYRYAGEVTAPGQPLLKIANLSQMTLRMYVAGDQMAVLKLDQEVTVRVDTQEGQMRDYQGAIKWLSAKAEFTPKTVQTKSERVNQVYAVKVLVPNDGFLKIGMPAEIEF